MDQGESEGVARRYDVPNAGMTGAGWFTGYFRDAATGLDYADQRYHQPGMGRFMTPDPYTASVGPADPGSWNRYAYTRGDPVNRVDRSGLYDTGVCDGIDFYLAIGDGCFGDGGDPGIGSGPSGDPNGCPAADPQLGLSFAGSVGSNGMPCPYWGAVPAPVVPVATTTCSLEVESFSLNALGGYGPDLHGSLYFTASMGSTLVSQDVVEGYTPDGKVLKAAVQPGNSGPVGNVAGTGTNDGTITGANVCGALAILQADVGKINGANISYGAYFGPNSSSALRYMLQSLQSLLGSSWYSIPWGLTEFGYNTKLPGLEGGGNQPPRPRGRPLPL